MLIGVEPVWCSFVVNGIARAKGSPQVITRGRGGKPLPFPRVIHDTPQLREWEKAVANGARLAMRDREPLSGVPVGLDVTVYSRRPKKHYRANDPSRELRADAPWWVTSTPDGDKILRGIGDALSGIVYDDDARVASYKIRKFYAATRDEPCAVITVTRLDAQTIAAAGSAVTAEEF